MRLSNLNDQSPIVSLGKVLFCDTGFIVNGIFGQAHGFGKPCYTLKNYLEQQAHWQNDALMLSEGIEK